MRKRGMGRRWWLAREVCGVAVCVGWGVGRDDGLVMDGNDRRVVARRCVMGSNGCLEARHEASGRHQVRRRRATQGLVGGRGEGDRSGSPFLLAAAGCWVLGAVCWLGSEAPGASAHCALHAAYGGTQQQAAGKDAAASEPRAEGGSRSRTRHAHRHPGTRILRPRNARDHHRPRPRPRPRATPQLLLLLVPPRPQAVPRPCSETRLSGSPGTAHARDARVASPKGQGPRGRLAPGCWQRARVPQGDPAQYGCRLRGGRGPSVPQAAVLRTTCRKCASPGGAPWPCMHACRGRVS